MSDINKPTILVVDDVPDNIDVLNGLLNADFKVKAALNGERALKIANGKAKPDMILLDIMMPDMDGYEVCRRLKNNPETSTIPVIFVTAKNQSESEEKGLALGAVDYITKPINPAIVKARIRTHLALYDQNRELAQQVKERTQELDNTRLQIIQRLGRAAEYKDDQTGLHVIRMSHYAKLIAQAYSNNEEWVELVFNAAPMHDIGKIGIPDNILLKPGKLDGDEWKKMQTHAEIGAQIIGNNTAPLLKLSRIIAISHHEKWDGSGYPNGLAEEDIALEGRIIAIADVFDALTSVRPYKKAWTVTDAVQLIKDNSGSHFDPTLVPLFLDILPHVTEIKEKYSEAG